MVDFHCGIVYWILLLLILKKPNLFLPGEEIRVAQCNYPEKSQLRWIRATDAKEFLTLVEFVVEVCKGHAFFLPCCRGIFDVRIPVTQHSN